jgi:hypothetical protein
MQHKIHHVSTKLHSFHCPFVLLCATTNFFLLAHSPLCGCRAPTIHFPKPLWSSISKTFYPFHSINPCNCSWSEPLTYPHFLNTFIVTTLALGSRPKQMDGKLWAENATQESHLHFWECEGMNPYIPSGLLLWELESLWSSEILESDFKG